MPTWVVVSIAVLAAAGAGLFAWLAIYSLDSLQISRRLRLAIHGQLKCDVSGCSRIATRWTRADWYTCDEHRPLTIPTDPLPHSSSKESSDGGTEEVWPVNPSRFRRL